MICGYSMRITQTCRNNFNRLTNNGTTMGDFTHIISICCPDDDSIKPINENHLILKMWDVDEVLENQFRKYEPPSEELCAEVIKAVDSWVMKCGHDLRLLIHCDAGVSRSAAIALGVVWIISNFFFRNSIPDNLSRDYIIARKEFCASLIDTESNSHFLKWYIEGKNLLRGVKPNQAILRHYRKSLTYFPW